VFHRILVPLDLSDRHARSIKLALALARHGPARVTLVHVIQQVRGLLPGEMRAFYDRLVKTSRRGLARAAKLFAARGIPVRSEVLVGEPAREIVRAAAAARADLIVMGSHPGQPEAPRHGLGHDQLQGRDPLPLPHPAGQVNGERRPSRLTIGGSRLRARELAPGLRPMR